MIIERAVEYSLRGFLQEQLLEKTYTTLLISFVWNIGRRRYESAWTEMDTERFCYCSRIACFAASFVQNGIWDAAMSLLYPESSCFALR